MSDGEDCDDVAGLTDLLSSDEDAPQLMSSTDLLDIVDTAKTAANDCNFVHSPLLITNNDASISTTRQRPNSTSHSLYLAKLVITAVLVTGAVGFLGCHLCRQLITSGYKVFAATRDVDSECSKEFKKLFQNEIIDSRLFVVKLDLRNADDCFSCMQNCDYVINAAATTPFDSKDDSPAKVIAPALTAIQHILSTAEKYCNKRIKRIINISCSGAIWVKRSLSFIFLGGNIDPKIRQQQTFTEAHFATGTGLDLMQKSKAMAEKEASRLLAKLKDRSFEFVTIVPAYLMGPLLLKKKNLCEDVNVYIPMIDVRDAAKIIVKALEYPGMDMKRVILFTGNVNTYDATTKLAQQFPNVAISLAKQEYFDAHVFTQKFLPEYNIRIDFVTDYVCFPHRIAHSIIMKELKLSSGDLVAPMQSVVDMAFSVIDTGVIKPRYLTELSSLRR